MRRSVAKNSVIDRKYETATAGTYGVKNKNSNGAQAGMPMFLRRNMSNTSDAILIRRQEAAEEEEEVLQTKANDFMQRQAEEEEEEELLQAKLENSVIQRQTNEDEEEEALQTKVSAGSLQRQPNDEEEEMLQSKSQSILQRQAEEEEELQAKLDVGSPDDEYEKEADAVADQVMRMESPNLSSKNVQPAIRRKSTGSNSGTPKLSTGSEQRIQSMRGSGSPLPQHISNDMGSKIGADFSQVGVHTGSDATDLNKEVNARAFTIGNDVFFNNGEYSPESSSGKRLLAHELTHVVQQNDISSRNIMRNGTEDVSSNDTGNTEEDSPQNILQTFHLPAVKARHLALYQAWASRGVLKRVAGYARGRPNQIRVWKNYFWNKMQNLNHLGLHEDFRGTKKIQTPAGNELRGRRRTLLKKLTIPDWDKRGNALENTTEVDHIIELQTGGWPSVATANEIENMECLDKPSNASAGSKTRSNIEKVVRDYKEAMGETDTQAAAQGYLANNDIVFTRVVLGQGDRAGSTPASIWWSRTEIEQGQHLTSASSLGNVEEPGTPDSFALMSPDDGMVMGEFSHDENLLSFEVDQGSTQSTMIAGLRAHSITLNNEYDSKPAGDSIGRINVTWNLPEDLSASEEVFTVGLKKSESQYAGFMEDLPGLETAFPHMSLVRFGQVSMDEDGLDASGLLIPSLSLLGDMPIEVRLEGRDLTFALIYSAENLSVPIPGLTIDSTSLQVNFGTRGFGAAGEIEFVVDRLGNGELTAAANSQDGFSLTGEFNFDERIFGAGSQAQARMAYQKAGEVYQWSMGGTLTIPEGKVPGVRSATINVDYSEASGFSAQGDAQLDVPGVESGTLSITQSEEEGFIIGGTFSLSGDTPGIRGGSISAQVRERPDGQGYAVSARGEAQPDIPGINSNLIVSYDDGAFTAEITADYARGMLSGEVNAGVTNRTVGEDGQLSETALPDNPLIVYGGGSLTIQIAPWLQGTAGVQFAPNGEITVTGEIGLPDELEIFARREINRSIFNIAVQAPIFPGIVAEIGGGLGATAGIGPGVIDELRLGITYNPAHEEDTTITGDAHLNVPADAGLRVSVRAGIGLGITGASATGGLEIGGTLGIDGVAEAGVHVDWSPASGLDLTANVSVHAQPAFAFDISGYVSVRALGFSVYDETWELASFRFGSDYRFGISLPIHYQEGQPFNISTDDIEFEVPDIDTEQLLKGLISRIA